MSKSIIKSKTFWANLIAMAATVLGFFELEITPEQQTTLVGGIFTAVNIVMRLISKDEIHVISADETSV